MDLKLLGLGIAASLTLIASPSYAHPASPAHDTAQGIVCAGDNGDNNEFFELGGFSSIVHNPHGVFWSGFSPSEEIAVDMGIEINGPNLQNVSMTETSRTGGFLQELFYYYTTNGSDLLQGTSGISESQTRAGLTITFNRAQADLPRGARVVEFLYTDFGEGVYSDNVSKIFVDSHPAPVKNHTLLDCPFPFNEGSG